LSKLDQTGVASKLDQTGVNWSKLEKTGVNWSKLEQTGAKKFSQQNWELLVVQPRNIVKLVAFKKLL
jgi:hypothetical protein